MSETSYWKILTRRKPFKDLNENISNNGRVLNVFELTGLGIGATIGVGVYVLVGHVARDLAGPSAILSFVIAAIASLLAGLSYAEFGSRIPRSGSSYLYTFTILGEFIAFIIGWNLIFEYIIGSAAAARAISLYLDAVTDNLFKITFLDMTPINTSFLADYFDLLALSIPIILSIGLALGLRKSTIINNIFTIINLFLILFIIITGSLKADPNNWKIDSSTIPVENHAGKGGFFPYGFEGTLQGAAISFFAYAGIDFLLTSGEKVANPKKSIPKAIIFSIFAICLIYVCISTVLTLMWPYYLHDINTPLANVFVVFGWEFAKWFVVIGGIFALTTGLYGGMFALPKILYDMVDDGLIFKFLGTINSAFKTPVTGILICGLLTGLMSALFNLQQLVSMMSIGTLLAFTIVSLSVMILRFTEDLEEVKTIKSGDEISAGGFIIQIFNCKCSKPSKLSMIVVRTLSILFCIVSLVLSLIIKFTITEIQNMEVWALSLSGTFLGILLLILLGISVQPRPKIVQSYFKVPLVPLLPAISIFMNIYLMLMLDTYTWIRFGTWMVIGLAVYLSCMLMKRDVPSDVIKNEIADPYFIEAKIEPEMQEIQKSSIPNETYSTDETKIFGNNNDEDEEDRAPTPETINSPVLTSNGVSIKKTKARAPPTPVSTKIDEKVQTKGFEYPDPVEVIKITTPTSSKSSSYDEIILASDASNVLTEKKEPNGKAYFVEEVSKSPDPFQRKSYEDKETSFALAFLDDVLKTEEKENEETIAVIHYSDEGEQSREESPVPSPIPPPPPPPPPPPMYSPLPINNSKKIERTFEPLKTEEEQNYTTEEDRLKFGSKKQRQFMDRLSILIAGGETPLKPKTVYVKNKEQTNDDSVIVADRPVLRKSKSEPFLPSLLLEEIKSRNPDNPKTPEILEAEVVKIPEPPKFDEELFNKTNSILPSPLPIVPASLENGINEDEKVDPAVSEIKVELPTNIPEPPKFDEELFKTLDKKYSVFVPNQSPTLSTVSTPRPRLKSIPTVEVPTAPKEDEEEDLSKSSVKKKLEAIFKIGPPPRIGFQKPPPDENLPKKPSTPVTPKEEEKIEVRVPTKPDTLGRSKILFNDVLKSIKPDTRPSVIRNDSMKKTDHPDNITDF